MRQMAKSSRRSVKSLTINRSRDFVVDKLLKPCEEGNHSRCTGWAMLKKELSEVNANYFLKCTCGCHRKKQSPAKQVRKAPVKKTIKKKAKRKPKRQAGKKKTRKARRR